MEIVLFVFLFAIIATSHAAASGAAAMGARLFVGLAHVGEEWGWPGGFPGWRADRLGRPAPSRRRSLLEASGLVTLLVALSVLSVRHPEAGAMLAGVLAADLLTHLPWGGVYSPGVVTAYGLFPPAIVDLLPAVDVAPWWTLAGAVIIGASWLVARLRR